MSQTLQKSRAFGLTAILGKQDRRRRLRLGRRS